jgi:hypothetical protein
MSSQFASSSRCEVVKARVRSAVGIMAVAGGLAGMLAALAAQTPASQAFEVASVKPVKHEEMGQRPFGCGFEPGGRFSAFGTVRWLIACAYGIQPARAALEMVGAPAWFDSDLFE